MNHLLTVQFNVDSSGFQLMTW